MAELYGVQDEGRYKTISKFYAMELQRLPELSETEMGRSADDAGYMDLDC